VLNIDPTSNFPDPRIKPTGVRRCARTTGLGVTVDGEQSSVIALGKLCPNNRLAVFGNNHFNTFAAREFVLQDLPAQQS